MVMSTALLVGLWCRKKNSATFYRPFLFATGFFLLVLTASALWGVDPQTSFVSSQSRTVGVGLTLVVFCAILPLAAWIQSPKNKRIFFLIYAAVAATTVVIAILQKIFPEFLTTFSDARTGSVFGNALFFGAYSALSIFILTTAAYTSHQRSDRIFYLTTTVLLSVALIFLTGAKASIIALAIGGATTLFGFLLTKNHIDLIKKLWFSSLAGLLPVLAAIGLLLFAWFTPRLIENHSPTTLAERFINWDIARTAIKTRPWLGFGPETYEQTSDLFFDPRLTGFGFHETYLDKPHNAQLETVLGSGFIGFGSYLIFIGIIGWTLTRLFKHGQISVLELWLGLGFLITREIQNGLLFETHGSLIPLVVFLTYICAKTHLLPQTKPLKTIVIKIFKSAVLAYLLIAAFYTIFIIIPIAKTPKLAIEKTGRPYARESLQAIGDSLFVSSEQINNPEKRAELTALLGAQAAPRLIFFGAKYYAQLFLATKNPADYSQAVELLNQTIKKMPARQESYLILAQLALANNDPAGALTALTASEHYGIYLGEFTWYKALALLALNQPAAAWPEIQKSLAINYEVYPQPQVVFVVHALQKAGLISEAETVARTLKLVQ